VNREAEPVLISLLDLGPPAHADVHALRGGAVVGGDTGVLLSPSLWKDSAWRAARSARCSEGVAGTSAPVLRSVRSTHRTGPAPGPVPRANAAGGPQGPGPRSDGLTEPGRSARPSDGPGEHIAWTCSNLASQTNSGR
jgi:hypothetical protein